MVFIKSATSLALTIVYPLCVGAIQQRVKYDDIIDSLKPGSQKLHEHKTKEHGKRESLESHLSMLITTVDQVVTIVEDFNETAFTILPQFTKHIDAISKLQLNVKKAVGSYYASDQGTNRNVVNWGTSLVVKLNTALGSADQQIKNAFAAMSGKSSGLIGRIRRKSVAVTNTLSAAQEAADVATTGYYETDDVATMEGSTGASADTASLLRSRAESVGESSLFHSLEMDRSVEQKSGEGTMCSQAQERINTVNGDINSLTTKIGQLNVSLPSLIADVMDTAKSSLLKIDSIILHEAASTTEVIPDMIMDALRDVQAKVKDVPTDLAKIASSVMDKNAITSHTDEALQAMDTLPGYVELMHQHISHACSAAK